METPKALMLGAAIIVVVAIVAAIVVAPSITQNVTPAASTFSFNPTGISTVAPPEPMAPKGTPMPSGDVIVQYKSGVIASPAAGDAINAANRQVGARLVQTSPVKAGLTLVKLPAGASVDAAVAAYNSNPAVDGAWPNYRYGLQMLPNDPGFPAEWGLRNTGQSVLNATGKPGDDINASGAWDKTTGSSRVIVAVVDGGVAIRHQDLAQNVGPGYDFVYNSTDPTPPRNVEDAFHGTHVAGTIGAVTNNRLGVAGVSPNVTIMPLQVFSSEGASDWTIIQAIKYAEQHGASIINLSLGGARYNEKLYQTIKESPLLFVCSAGNDGTNNDRTPSYPASFDLPNVISVAASDSEGALAEFSNYGHTSVDLAAPGVSIASTWFDYTSGYGYGYLDGTSMAAPFVSGAAALVKAAHPDYGAVELKSAILNTTNPLPAQAGKTVTGGMLDAGKAVSYDVSTGGQSPVTSSPVTPSPGDLSDKLTAYEQQRGLTVITPFTNKQDGDFTVYYGEFQDRSQGSGVEIEIVPTNSSASTAQVAQAFVQLFEQHGFSESQSNATVWIGTNDQGQIAVVDTGPGALAAVAGVPVVEANLITPSSASQQAYQVRLVTPQL